ncbi:hydrogenase expression/formation protein HypE [Aestuariibacter halophilus]|uniref:Hydrogenase expression/formation protein HypE n=1 Tax=Fluctibacter halophilus TaxID=226011 RepID=A0ABS8G4R1_9ALTE|nr:hydrogenase expression/formation protein HypE [Aestuariibacter halophilus]MCC2615584.1 hydrogenase expression/formation protein HypE [Aestuariibacter halophilus]
MRDEQLITLAHGAGGKASSALIQSVFVSAFGPHQDKSLQDAAVIDVQQHFGAGSRIAMTTDSYVVSPLFFPGGDIGTLAVCGTVNDLAVCGARPLCLSAAFILEEGLPIRELQRVVASMADTARRANVSIVTGDTKVVAKGQVDKVFITTTGLGVVPPGVQVRSDQAEAGDAVLVNGPIGDHGAAIMLARGDLGLSADVRSDCAALNPMIGDILSAVPACRVMRDATRGGVGAVLSEIAQASNVAIALDENALPVRLETQGICELLGLDPLFFANEGLVVVLVPQAQAEAVLSVMKNHPEGQSARQIGQVVEQGQPLLYINTSFGTKRMIELPYGIQLPRIC